MCYDRITWADLQRQEDGDPPLGLSFTSDEMQNWDEDDVEAAKLAMERDMYDRRKRNQ